MRKLLLPLLAGLWLIMSCGSKDALPKDVMPREKMQVVMYDLMRSTEFLNTYVFSKDSNINKQAESQKWHDKVFEIHKISRADFERSFTYYKTHPELMRVLMDSLNQKEVTAANTAAPIPTPENSKPDTTITPVTISPDSMTKAKPLLSGPDSVVTTKKLQMLMDSARKKRMVKSRR